RVRHATRAGREAFAQALAGLAGVPLDLVTFALCGEEVGVSTAGALRNGLALETVGDCVLTVDDDTICRLGAPPAPRDEVAFVSSSYAPELHAFSDRETLLGAMSWSDRDLLALHEEALGRSVSAVVAGRAPASISVEGASPAF